MADSKNMTILMLFAMAVFLVGTWINIKAGVAGIATGQVTTGTTEVTILQEVNVNVTDTIINFTQGRVLEGFNNATLISGTASSAGTVAGWNASAKNTTMELRNEGNTQININMTSNVNSSEFFCQNEIAGTNCNTQSVAFLGFYSGNITGVDEDTGLVNGEAGSCTGVNAGDQTSPTAANAIEITNSSEEKNVCTNLLPTPQSTDEMFVGAVLVVPDDAEGKKNATWTFIARAN